MKHEGWAVLPEFGVTLGVRADRAARAIRGAARRTGRADGHGRRVGPRPPARAAHPRLPPSRATSCRPMIEGSATWARGPASRGSPSPSRVPEIAVHARGGPAATAPTSWPDVVDALGLEHVTIHARRLETFRAPSTCVSPARSRLLGRPGRPPSGSSTPAGRLVYWAGGSFDPTQIDPRASPWSFSPPRRLQGRGRSLS